MAVLSGLIGLPSGPSKSSEPLREPEEYGGKSPVGVVAEDCAAVRSRLEQDKAAITSDFE